MGSSEESEEVIVETKECKIEAALRGQCGEVTITKEECLRRHCCYDENDTAASSCYYHLG